MYIEQEYEQGPIIVPYYVDAFAAFFGVGYNWTDERRALAEDLSSVHRAPALAGSGAAILLGVGTEGGKAELGIVPNVAQRSLMSPGRQPFPRGLRLEQSTSWRARGSNDI